MRHFVKIAEGVDVIPALLQLQRNDYLWDQNRERKDAPDSAHSAMSDIWVRYNDRSEYEKTGDFSRFNDCHEPVWYPAWYALPALRPIVFSLMARCEAVRLGGVLITRIPAGGVIEPHCDDSWHVHYYNTKCYVVLQSNPHCVNRTEDEFVAMRAGEVWTFDNTKMHEVANAGLEDRITLIVCLRCEP